jgi:hypothetical protein
MQVSSTFYIVLPIVALISLLLMCAFPLLVDSYTNKQWLRRSRSAPAAEVTHPPQAGQEGRPNSGEHPRISSARGS